MNKPLTYLLLLSVPGLMLCIIPVDGAALRFSWQMSALWLGGVAFTALLTSWWLRAFWLAALAVTALAAWPPNYEAYVSLLTVAVFLAAAEGFSRIDPDATMCAMRIAAGLLLAWILLQEAGVAHTWFPAQNAGPFNPNLGGVFLALCLPAFMAGGWWAAGVLVALGILIAKSTTAALAALTGAAVWCLITYRGRRRVLAGAAAALMLFAGVWFWRVDSLDRLFSCSRWIVWTHAALAIPAEPFGRGLGSWAAVFPLLASGIPALNAPTATREGLAAVAVFEQAHNEYVQAAFELGLQTLALIIAFLVWAIRKTATADGSPLTAQSAAGIAAVAVSCFGVFTFHVGPTALLGIAWLGMFLESHKTAHGGLGA